MTTSGTTNFSLDNADVLVEAFDRCGVRPTAITRDQMTSGVRSLNLELLSWSNLGINLWKVQPFSLQIVANQAVYTAGTGPTNIPAATVTMLDVYWSQINGGGAGINIDRIMIPMSRTQYDEFSNKLQPGTPTMYWFQKQQPRQVTIYQPPLQGYPTYQIAGHLMVRLQDANLGGAETPDIDDLAFDALCARMAYRLGRKYVTGPDKVQVMEGLDADRKEAWEAFADTNREDAPISMLPTSNFFRRGD